MCSRGYTLVDVLACLAAMGVAIVLLGPAVARSRQTAQEDACGNRLRTLGKAFLAFERDRGGYPPRRTGLGGSQPYGGWGSHVLPYLDEKLATNYHHDYDFFDPINQPVVQTRIATFLCPAAPADRVYTIESNASGNSRNPNKDTLFKAECGPNDFISSNGLSVPRQGFGLSWPEGLAGNQHQSMTDGDVLPVSKITDGLAHTFLLIEQAGAPQQWRLGKLFKGPGLFAGQNNSRGTWAGFGSIQFRVTDPEDGYSPGRGDDTDCVVNCNNTFGIYGFHEAGANVLLCDGSVRFVGQSLDGLTHARLTTRDDGQLISAEGW